MDSRRQRYRMRSFFVSVCGVLERKKKGDEGSSSEDEEEEEEELRHLTLPLGAGAAQHCTYQLAGDTGVRTARRGRPKACARGALALWNGFTCTHHALNRCPDSLYQRPWHTPLRTHLTSVDAADAVPSIQTG